MRYWIQFEITEGLPIGVNSGCGVTAPTLEDALALVRERIFKGADLPPIQDVRPDVDISSLDPNHVLPNIGNIFEPGIWFPMGCR